MRWGSAPRPHGLANGRADSKNLILHRPSQISPMARVVAVSVIAPKLRLRTTRHDLRQGADYDAERRRSEETSIATPHFPPPPALLTFAAVPSKLQM